MKILRIFLFPIVPIYFLVTWMRNKFYDLGIFKSKQYEFPVIAVGNLSTGGTGKTPMVEYIIRLLKDNYKLATLSRGYGRKTQGFLLGSDAVTAESLGDEPFQFYHKFKNDVEVAVDENRQHGISELRNLNNKPDVILLDDAFQHRKVKAGFYVLLTTYDKLYSDDFLLPTGNLREPREGAKRAHIIVVTKCPQHVTDLEKQKIKQQLRVLPNQKLFFSSISYSENVFSSTTDKPLKSLTNITLVTGIANPKPLTSYLKGLNLSFNHLKFTDHHHFTEQEIHDFEALDCILTTEKDFMRLKSYESLTDKLFYLPISIKIDNKEVFDKTIIEFVN
jgi:tetraacyldisaccharide 4'-kinase